LNQVKINGKPFSNFKTLSGWNLPQPTSPLSFLFPTRGPTLST
jgi:hypothetical protein